MSAAQCFTFSFGPAGAETHIHFIPPGVEDMSIIVEDYIAFRRKGTEPKNLIILGFKFTEVLLRTVSGTPEFVARSKEIKDVENWSPELWFFAENGSLSRSDHTVVEDAEVQAVQKAGIMEICRGRSVVIETDDSFHYVKPSKSHVDKFVRTANALVVGAEVMFIASWLLRFMNHSFRVIHCDTSGIASIAYASLHLKALFSGKVTAATISSFGSYAGLRGNALDSPSSCLVLISATTSESMAELIVNESNVVAEYIITLFYLGEKLPRGRVLCDLTKSRNVDGWDPASNHDEATCELCARGSIPLQMEGDGFMPEPPKVTLCTISSAQLPLWLHSFLSTAVKSQALSCNVSVSSNDTTHEVFLDAHRLLSIPDGICAKWERLLSRGVPVDVKRIIFFKEDEASAALATELQNSLASKISKPPDLIGFGRGTTFPAGSLSDQGVSVVIASAIVKGRRITAVSGALRASPGPIVYLAVVSRTESPDVHKRIRSNLVKSNSGVDHALYVAVEVYLPPARQNSVSSWACERRLLEERDNCSPLPNVLSERLSLLLKGKEDDLIGLRKRVFLPDPKGNALALQRNSIFFPPDIDVQGVSQADVFFAVSSVLHKLRSDAPGAGKLGRGPRHHALLDPKNFERYTDGILQAALLRAALPVELDYSVDSAASESMLGFLNSVFHDLNSLGNSALEFALALATDRLRLSARDHKQLVEQFRQEEANYPEILQVLVGLIIPRC